VCSEAPEFLRRLHVPVTGVAGQAGALRRRDSRQVPVAQLWHPSRRLIKAPRAACPRAASQQYSRSARPRHDAGIRPPVTTPCPLPRTLNQWSAGQVRWTTRPTPPARRASSRGLSLAADAPRATPKLRATPSPTGAPTRPRPSSISLPRLPRPPRPRQTKPLPSPANTRVSRKCPRRHITAERRAGTPSHPRSRISARRCGGLAASLSAPAHPPARLARPRTGGHPRPRWR
jgi:hypothetical protein